jgi:HD-GYP domain-containing protein (c-di-GMP phosphodiesterase class II)
MNAAEAMAVLKAGAFKQWDGDCVDALAQALSNR